MNVWESNEWKKYYSNKSIRNGIRVSFEPEVNEDVKKAIKDLVKWLRKRYNFPMRICVYVKKTEWIKASDGDIVRDLFFWPDSRDDEPYIRLATGDYFRLLSDYGKERAMINILFSFLKDLTHYYQWLNNKEFVSKSLKSEATRCAKNLLAEYRETRDNIWW